MLPALGLLACDDEPAGDPRYQEASYEPGDPFEPGGPYAPGGNGLACEVPMCGTGRLTAGLNDADSAPPKRRAPILMGHRDPEAAYAAVHATFAANGPTAQTLVYWARTARGFRPEDATWPADFPRPSPQAAAWLAHRLDQATPEWSEVVLRPLGTEAITPETPEVQPVDEGSLAPGDPTSTLKQPLETAGCGDMRLRLALESVEVIERDDNFAGDRIYCFIQSEDAQGQTEVYQSEITPNLHPYDTHRFVDGVYFGRDLDRPKGRDPGARLEIVYDCFEVDDEADYEDMREIISLVRTAAKYTTPDITAALLQGAAIAELLVDIAVILDGNDHLYTHRETLSRDALWSEMMGGPRRLSMRGTNNLSEWSWVVTLSAGGCAEATRSDDGFGGLGGSGGSGGMCTDTCSDAYDGYCDDGGPSSDYAICPLGTDCFDCGARSDSGGASGAGGSGGFGGFGGSGGSGGAPPPPDPTTATYDVLVHSGEIDEYKPNGDGWDAIGGSPDPYVTLESGGRSGATHKLSDTWYPDWGGVTVLQGATGAQLLRGLAMTIVDDDVAADDIIGNCTLAVERADLDTGPFGLTCGSIAFDLEIRRR